MPAFARQRSTTAGAAVTLTPSASKTSALPDRLDTDRLPCLATFTPHAATTMAAQDEILNVPERSPPVPHVSNTVSAVPERFDSCTACARIVFASPTISAGRSPFIASPMSRPAIWAGVARPSITAAIAAEASSTVRSSRRVSLSIRSGNIETVLDKVSKDSLSFSRKNRLRVKLDAVHGPRAMAQPHDRLVLARARRYDQVVRQAIVGHHQRVIPRGEERSVDAGKHATA